MNQISDGRARRDRGGIFELLFDFLEMVIDLFRLVAAVIGRLLVPSE